ncbi:hypothetical protein F4806DRAFT_505649 [Annulohypoxylon nitens]|nr:hypothetical protein F4806DRAFT_505649 [Annulohypoxylon nitens]
MASQMGGALPPPPGIEPNFIDPPSQAKGNLTQHATCLTLVTMFVAMRIYTRLRINRTNLGIDDYFCVLSYALDWTYSMLMIKSHSEGLGRHIWDVPATWVIPALKYLVFASYAYLLLTGCIKLTFLFCYRRIFSMHSLTNTFINLGIAFVVCLHTGLLFATIFSCDPVDRSWDASVPGTCFNAAILPWVSAASSSLTDIYIFVLPIAPLWRLNMDSKRKVKVTIVFSFGLIACIASLVRLGMTRVLQSSLDATWNTSSIGKWSGIEVDVGIICSCLMALPAFLDRHLPERVKAVLTRSWFRVSAISSQKTKVANVSLSKSENSWPRSRYKHLAEGRSSEKIIQAPSFVLETVHVPKADEASTASS